MEKRKTGSTTLLLISWLFLLAAGTTLAADSGSNAPTILPPQTTVYGRSYGEWLNQFFIWWLETPREMDPVADQTGEVAPARQTGDVWFLATSDVGANPQRTITIPAGKALFFPIALSLYTEIDDPSSAWNEPFTDSATDSEYASRAKYWLERTKSDLETMTAISCEIDGKSVPNLRDYVVSSPATFHGVVPEDGNRLGRAGPYVGMGAGCCLMIASMAAGEHAIHALDTFANDAPFELTDTITVSAGPTVSLVRNGPSAVVTFTGVLQSAETVIGLWVDSSGPSPQTFPTSNSMKFIVPDNNHIFAEFSAADRFPRFPHAGPCALRGHFDFRHLRR